MEQAEIIRFIVMATAILLLFTGGILMFIVQYRKRRMMYDRETALTAERHQHELLNTRYQIQEQTMQDIGREIHDNVGQRLTLASIYTNQLLASAPAGDARLASVGSIISESLAELRLLSKSLVSTEADSAELTAVIRRECARVGALGICEVSCDATGVHFSISATVKNFVVRILQEALQNSLKHANCSRIDVALQMAEPGLILSVEDKGAGFEQDASHAGIGLQNMRRRAELIGAEFSVTSVPGSGTAIRLFIPQHKLAAG